MIKKVVDVDIDILDFEIIFFVLALEPLRVYSTCYSKLSV